MTSHKKTTPRPKPLKSTEVPEPEATDVPVPDPDVPGDDARAETPGAPAAPEAEDELTKAFNEPPEWIADHQLPEDKVTDVSAGPDDVELDDEPDIFEIDPLHPWAIFFRQDDETLEVSLQPIPEWQPTETGEEYSDRLRLRNQFLARLRVAIDREQFYLDDVLKSTAREIAAQAARGRQV